MSLPVVFRAEALAEFDEAFDDFEARRPGLGIDFADRFQDALDRIAASPEMYALVFADLRRTMVVRFPDCIDFRAEAERVEVIAVFDTSRNPSIWQGRA